MDNKFDKRKIEQAKKLNSDILVDDYEDGYFEDGMFVVTKLKQNCGVIFINDNIKEDITTIDPNKYKIIYAGYYKLYPVIVGGLGNQLYIISAAINFCVKNGYKLIYDKSLVEELHVEEKSHENTNYLIMDHYKELYKYFTVENVDRNKSKFIRKDDNDLTDIKTLWPHQIIAGYFQSTNFMTEINVKNIFRNFIKISNDFETPEIVIHLRRGDFVKNPEIFSITEVSYIEEVSKLLPDGEITIIGQDIEWYKPQLDPILKDRIVKYRYGNMITDFKMLSNTTKAMVLGPSTFSWWAGYLNPNKDVKIYAPKRWMSRQKNIKESEKYYVDGWKLISDHYEILNTAIDLRNQRKHRELDEYLNMFNLLETPRNNAFMFKILDEYYIANYYLGNYDKCVQILKYYKYNNINEHIINNTDYLFDFMTKNKKVIVTTDINRTPKDDEFVIIYGDFPWMYENLIINNPCYRHFKYFDKLKYDIIEYDNYWDNIDKIYIINLDTRSDRYFETMSELIKLNVPLNKIERFSAILAKEWGCSASHLEVIKDIIKNKHQNCLILEDDFKITSLIGKNKNNIKSFLEREYDYDVCFISYRNIDNKNMIYDDLLYNIRIPCTNASGYFISLTGALNLLPIWEKALENFKETKQHQHYACDVSWNILQQNNKYFAFINKVGYQRPQYSNYFFFYMF